MHLRGTGQGTNVHGVDSRKNQKWKVTDWGRSNIVCNYAAIKDTSLTHHQADIISHQSNNLRSFQAGSTFKVQGSRAFQGYNLKTKIKLKANSRSSRSGTKPDIEAFV